MMPKRLLITGTREGWDLQVLYSALQMHYEELGGGDVILVHGAAVGVDGQASIWWTAQGRPIEGHRADWKRFGRAAGPRRNSEMVALGADLCIGFIGASSVGTVDCLKKAEKAGIRCVKYYGVEDD